MRVDQVRAHVMHYKLVALEFTGSEASDAIAKADLVPTDANLLDAGTTFGELRAEAAVFCDTVNRRVQRGGPLCRGTW